MKKSYSFLASLFLALMIFTGIFSIMNDTVSAGGYSLDSTYKLMAIGSSYNNTVNTSAKVNWTSSNTDVASVYDGTIYAKKTGVATITASVGASKLSMKVEVVDPAVANAVSYANSCVGKKYSQGKRMQAGYYDCSSLVWRSYASAGVYIGSTKSAPTAAELAKSLYNSNKTVALYGVDASKLLPGDAVFSSYARTNRFRGISHAAFYAGNGKLVEAANTRKGVVRSNYSAKRVVYIGRPVISKKTYVPDIENMVTLKSAVACTDGSIKVTWEKVDGAESYNLYRKTAETGWKRITTTDASTVSYSDQNTNAATKYFYTVRASKKGVLSAYDKAGVSAAAKVAKVSDVEVTAKKKGIQITWTGVEGADGYQLYRQAEGDSKNYKIALVGADVRSYLNKAAKEGLTYTYSVRAYKLVNGKKVFSASQSAEKIQK